MLRIFLIIILCSYGCTTAVGAEPLPYYRTIPEVRAMSDELEETDIRLVAFLLKDDGPGRDYLLFEQEKFSQFPGLTKHQLAVVMLSLPEEADLKDCEDKWVVISGKYRQKTRSSGALGFRDQLVPKIIATLEGDRTVCPLGEVEDVKPDEIDNDGRGRTSATD